MNRNDLLRERAERSAHEYSEVRENCNSMPASCGAHSPQCQAFQETFIAGADYQRDVETAGAARGAIEALRWAANAVCNGCRNHMPIAASETCFAQPIHDEIASRLKDRGL